MPRKIFFDHLTGDLFEKLCYELFHALGYENVRWHRGTGKKCGTADDGCDISFEMRSEGLGGKTWSQKWAVQCKFKSDRRGVPRRDLGALLEYAESKKPDGILFVTNAFLSRAAKDYLSHMREQKRGFQVEWWEHPDLTHQLKQKRGIQRAFDLTSEVNSNYFDHLCRTQGIVNEMEKLLKSNDLRNLVIRIQAAYSSLANLDEPTFPDVDSAHYGKLLVKERDTLISLLRRGATLRAVIHPPSLPRINAIRAKARIQQLLTLLTDTRSLTRKSQIALSPEEGPNLLFLGDDVLFEGHKTHVKGGYGFTHTIRDKDYISRRVGVFDRFFESAKEYTIQEFLPLANNRLCRNQTARGQLRAATIQGLIDIESRMTLHAAFIPSTHFRVETFAND
jgi:hypothetical protein